MVQNKLLQQGRASKISRVFSPVKLVIYIALIVALWSAWSWWHYIYNSSERVFWGMIDNNLKTTSFTRSVQQRSDTQSLRQTTDVRTAPQQLTNNTTEVDQNGSTQVHVVTQTIGTPVQDFVRYTEASTSQKSTTGQALDFTKILNTWGKTDAQGGTTNGQAYNESVLGIIPFGNLTLAQRKELVSLMRSSKMYTYTVTKSSNPNFGRASYVYNVQVKPEAYITVMKKFAGFVGLTQLEGVDPAQYASAEVPAVDVTIDGMSRQIRSINYNDEKTERIVGYNSKKVFVQPPQQAIAIEELQSRLQSIQ